MSQLQFSARQRRGISSTGNGFTMFRQSSDLRKIAVENNAYVHKIDFDDSNHWDAVLQFLQEDPAGPKLSLSVDGCGEGWTKKGAAGPESGWASKVLVEMEQMDLLRDWLAGISDENNSEWMQESESAFQVATCLLYTSPSPRDGLLSRMPSSA